MLPHSTAFRCVLSEPVSKHDQTCFQNLLFTRTHSIVTRSKAKAESRMGQRQCNVIDQERCHLQDAIDMHKNEATSKKDDQTSSVVPLTEGCLLQLPQPTNDYTLKLFLDHYVVPIPSIHHEAELATYNLYPSPSLYREPLLIKCRAPQKGLLSLHRLLLQWLRFFTVLILATIISIVNGPPDDE